MSLKPTVAPIQRANIANAVRSWTMIVLTLSFGLIYGAALLGWVKPLSDEMIVSRLEPIIFVILGYYFGRLPSQQNENMLKEEIRRQTQRADAAQHAKEQAQQVREMLEEKFKNVRAALSPSVLSSGRKGADESSNKQDSSFKDDIRHSLTAAMSILNS